MATNLKFSLTLEPVGYEDHWPDFYIKVDRDLYDANTLTDTCTYNFDVTLADGAHSIIVGFTNKGDQDTVVHDDKIVADKAVIVKTVDIEGYVLDDFLYRAQYFPIGKDVMQSNYLSWNGEWRLDITTPIFTWIHKTQHLGWIYGEKI